MPVSNSILRTREKFTNPINSHASPASRLANRCQLAEDSGISDREVSNWVTRGLLPPPLSGTRRWDFKAVEQHLDRLSGLTALGSENDPFAEWMAGRDARTA